MKPFTYYGRQINLHFSLGTFTTLLFDLANWRFELHWSNKHTMNYPRHYLRLRAMRLPHPNAGFFVTKWQWIRR